METTRACAAPTKSLHLHYFPGGTRLLGGLTAALLALPCLAAVPDRPSEPQIKKIRVFVSEADRERMGGEYRRGLGSGLAFTGRSRAGGYEFLTINNPGGEPARQGGSGEDPGRFPPCVARIRVQGESATLHDALPLKEPYRISPGGLTPAGEGSVWVADEHGPALLRFSLSDGRVLEMFRAGIELPALLMQRQTSRGFSGVSLVSGRLFAVMQSTLNIQGQTRNTATFTRLLELDVRKRASAMYAVPIDSDLYASRSEASVGDMAAIGERRFLTVEQGLKPGLEMASGLYLLDLSKSARIEARGRKKQPPIEPEYIPNALTVFGKGNAVPVPVKKTLLVDLARHGFGFSKAEGLALLDDGRTVVISVESHESRRNQDDDLDTGMELWFVTLSKPFAVPRGQGVDLSGVGALMAALVIGIVALKFFAWRRSKLG